MVWRKWFGTFFRRGYDLSLQDRHGESPLQYAAEGGHYDIVEMLVRAGSDISLKEHSPRTPLDCAQGRRWRLGVARSQERYDKVIDFLAAWADPENPVLMNTWI